MNRSIANGIALFLALAARLAIAVGPQAGDVYREICNSGVGGNKEWRVTDPNATARGAQQFLPNPTRTLVVDSLEGVIRAEAVIDRWGGHLGTTNKRLRFNKGAWLPIAEPAIASEDRAIYFYYQDNPTIEVPLETLKAGLNTFEGACDAASGHGWGQWGLYALTLRLYYDAQDAERVWPAAREIAIESPSSGATFDENPKIDISADGGLGVSRIDVFAHYDGYDIDGDGRTSQWQEARFKHASHEGVTLQGHVGTLYSEPYELTWDTRWVPDQAPGSIRLIARALDRNGLWRVSEVVDDLTLARPDSSVRLYTCQIPERFGVRVGQSKQCAIHLPEDFNASAVSDAAMLLRTWHGWDGHHNPLTINGHKMPIRGKNHFYDFDRLPLSAAWLRPGENLFGISSDTHHHMLEVLAPGPAIIVRTDRQ